MAETKRVFVIDDDPKMCHVLESLLTDRGYGVTVCTDSNDAIRLLKEAEYHCVLLDIRMKGLEGTELLPIIKRNFPDVPVIIVSAYCDRSDSGYYTSLGAFDLVTKPFNNDLLGDIVKRAVGETETIPLLLTSFSLLEARNQVYRKLIVTALRKTNWNQVKAAELLGVSRYCLMRWLRKLQITY